MNLKYLISFIAVMILLIIFSYFFIDRQLVWFLYTHYSRQMAFLKAFATIIVITLTFLITVSYLYFCVKLVTNRITPLDRKILTCSNAVVIASFCNETLKIVFGRYWPATFVCNNPSLIQDHVYGFSWFKFGIDFASFPSAHASFIFAFSTSLWCLFPKFRWLAVLLALLVVWGQIGMYYHFVSDILAGILLGSLVGVSVYRASLLIHQRDLNVK